jgi:hypothetical protein
MDRVKTPAINGGKNPFIARFIIGLLDRGKSGKTGCSLILLG